MLRIITVAFATAFVSCLSVTATAAKPACDEFVAKRQYGPSAYGGFIYACLGRQFKRDRKADADKWANCVNHHTDSAKPDSSDEWLKIMTACVGG